jgi:hypothetical protein
LKKEDKMKIKIEPDLFKKLIEAGMIYHNKPNIDPLVVQFKPEGIIIADTFKEVMVVHMVLDKKYFLEYEAKDEVVAVPSVVLAQLGWSFLKDDKFYVSTKENKIFFEGKTENYDTELEDMEPRKFPWPMKKNEDGYMLPEPLKDIESGFKLDIRELELSKPPADNYIFRIKNKKLTISTTEDVNWHRELNGQPVGDKDIELILDADYFNAIIANLDGEILFILTESLAIFAEKGTGYTKTLVLAGKEQG